MTQKWYKGSRVEQASLSKLFVDRRLLHLFQWIYIQNYKLIKKSFRKQKEMETPFIKKVKKILEDPENADIICWNNTKTTIEIKNQKLFQEKVLSLHFRHSRISSFVRQLNLYGFKKIRSTQNRIFTHALLSQGMGLDSIIHKKKKHLKCLEQEEILNSHHFDPVFDRNIYQTAGNSKKQITSEYRISQNLVFLKQNSKEDKSPLSTKNTINHQEPSLNTIWFVPVPNMQQQIWKFPCGLPQENPRMNFTYGIYPNWC